MYVVGNGADSVCQPLKTHGVGAMKVTLLYTKRDKAMYKFRRLYGSEFEVDRFENNLVYLKGVPAKDNGWHVSRWEIKYEEKV